MLAFVVRKTSITINRKNPKTKFNDLTRLKMMEKETKEKVSRIKNFDPVECYDFSQSKPSINLDDSLVFKEGKLPLLMENTASTNNADSAEIRVEKKLKFDKRVMGFKNIIKWLDILASVLIIAGCFISQVEGENYYDDNLTSRVETIKFIRDLKKFSGDISKLELISYNISYIQDGTYRYQGVRINFTLYEEIPFSIKISENCQKLRYAIMALTLISLPLIYFGRYYEFVRDYIYLQKIESKNN
jgi:hypothetical protein